MKKLSGAEIRRMWLDFFASKGHYIEPGASLIPHNDPTLLWINSGVAALKKYFDGSETTIHHRITNAQKSIRTNDIENVGKTARHHTFFEMLGNFSIGDYFRKEVIPWAYELLTSEKYFAIPKEKLYITYHPSDLETKNLWIEQGIDSTHLVPSEENFWEIGEGPCGPNTEIYFDRGEQYDPSHLGERLLFEDIENDRYIEMWNIVFSQYNAELGKPRSEYKELPRKNIDTGAGLERLACIFQETETNFETDLFYPYIEAILKVSSYPYEGEYKMAYRVIADHIRTCVFALADGASFSNEGRGYVLRRILRRAVRYLKKLGINKPYLYTLVPLVSKNMEDYYPYLYEHEERIMKMIRFEEEKFASTLASGEAMLAKMLKDVSDILPGSDAFKLYDTYGFPFELTKEIAQEQGIKVDQVGFEKEMKAQKERARASRGDLQSMGAQAQDLLEFVSESIFTYEIDDLTSKVIGLFKDGKKVDVLDDEGEVIFDKTNFYATSGGQIHDIGTCSSSDFEGEITDVIKAPNHQHLHHVKVNFGSLHIGDTLTLTLDKERRRKIQKNHSALHLLQSALQHVLGKDVHQEGSYVCDEYARFDFNYPRKISNDELQEIEKEVNSFIYKEIDSDIQEMPIEEAKKSGAMALFSEKYGEIVRVVSFGDVSKEFCGGTHVKNTRDLGLFVITSEGAIASGIRRIEVKTSFSAYEYFMSKNQKLQEVTTLLGAKNIAENSLKIKSLIEENTSLKKKNHEFLDSLSSLKAKEFLSAFEVINNKKVLLRHLSGMDKEMFSSLFDHLKGVYDPSIILLALVEDGKISYMCSVSKSLQEKFSAGDLVKKVALMTLGSGGGRKDVAQGGGKDPSKLVDAFKEIRKVLES